MSSSSALKYKIQTQASFVAKLLAIILLLLSAVGLFLLWGVGWFSLVFLAAYIITCFYVVYSFALLPFSCRLSDSGNIEIDKPEQTVGHINPRSFYNGWFLFLCDDLKDKLLISNQQSNNKKQRWFVVFYDSVAEEEYRLLARLVTSARWR